MKRTYVSLIAALCLTAGCGGTFDATQVSGESRVSAIEIRTFPDTVRVGSSAVLSLTITLDSGEQFTGLTTSFNDPDTDEPFPIEWSTSNGGLAGIVDGSTLVPAAPGSITVRADVMGVSQTKSIRIFDGYEPSLSPSPGMSAPEEGTETDETPADTSLCRGHAVAVASFTPGAGAGFGADSMPGIVLGPPHGMGNVRGSVHVVSLGRAGEIVLDLGDCALSDGPGTDLIVFENAFFISGDEEDPYAELGIVGVSENGADFFEFTCEQDAYPYTGCAGWDPVYSSPLNGIDPFDVAAAGGDHFDLEDIGVESARYVRIRDAGTAGFGTSVGFDLDAVSVVNGIRETP